MQPDKLVEYIKKELEKSHSKEKVRAALIKSGWDPELVDDSFKKMNGSQKKWLFLALAVIVIASTIYAYKFSPKIVRYRMESSIQKGNELCVSGDYEGAQRAFEKAMKVNNIGSSRPNYFRGMCYKMMGDHGFAIANFEQAIEIQNNLPDFYYRLGDAYCSMGAYDEGIKSIDHGLEITNSSGHNNIKFLREALKSCQQAKKK